jgi:hypothetical protein
VRAKSFKMDKDINELYQAAMKPIMKQEAKTHKSFLTQKEFEKNMGKIFIITGARRNLEEKVRKANAL